MPADGGPPPETRVDLDAECTLLGEVLLDPRALPEVAAAGLVPEDFGDGRNKRVFEAALAVWKRRVEVGLTTVADELRSHNRLEAVGGYRYLTSLGDLALYSPVQARRLAEIVRAEAVARDVLRAAREIAARVAAGAPAAELVEQLAAASRGVAERAARTRARPYAEFAEQFLTEYLDRAESGARFAGVPFGLTDLDYATGGILASELGVIAADTGHGKSALALQFALNVAAWAAADAARGVVLLGSLEMRGKEIAGRGLAADARVDLGKFRSLSATVEDLTAMSRCAGAAHGVPLWINDDARMTLAKLHAEASLFKQRAGLALLVVDYCQILALSLKRQNPKLSEYEAISEVSRELKLLAMDLDVPVLMLSQFNRDYSKRARDKADARASLADLKGSSGIGQDANLVLLMRTDHDARFAEVEIAKHRSGRKGTVVRLRFEPELTRFSDYASDAPLPDDPDRRTAPTHNGGDDGGF